MLSQQFEAFGVSTAFKKQGFLDRAFKEGTWARVECACESSHLPWQLGRTTGMPLVFSTQAQGH